jgi:hypothetical protein
MELAVASLVCTGICIGCLVYLHLAPTGYSPVRDAVSRYGVGAYARWYQAQAAFCGVAGILLAIGVARLAITQFPMDTRLRGHALLAIVAFGSMTSAAIRLKPEFHGTPALGYAMLAALLAGMLLRRIAFGVAERAFYAAMLAWLVLVAARLV